MNDPDAVVNASLEELVAAWKHQLSPWLHTPQGKIKFPSMCCSTRVANATLLADRDELQADFWLLFALKRSYETSEWVQWLEALELLGLLASVNTRVCWNILFEMTNGAHELRRLGRSQQDLYEMRPRYEFRIAFDNVPSRAIFELLLEGVSPTNHTDGFANVRNHLMDRIGARYSFPVHVRFRFSLGRYNVLDSTVIPHCFEQILARANQVATFSTTNDKLPMRVESFGFEAQNVPMTDCVCDWLRLIAAAMPIFDLVYGVSTPIASSGNSYGPFLWQLLAPYASLQPQLGLQRLSIRASSIDGNQLVGLCSALAESQSLREVSFVDDVTAASWRWACWLAYALFSTFARHCIRKVSLNVGHRLDLYAKAMEKVLTHTNPVAYLRALQTNHKARKTSYNWAATTVRVPANAWISDRSLVPSERNKQTTVFHDNELVPCHIASRTSGPCMVVLIPCGGFEYVAHNDIEPTMSTRADAHAVRSLSLQVKRLHAPSAVTLLEQIGYPLTSLSLVDSAATASVDIRALTAPCPHLKRLRLEKIAIRHESFDWGHELESLALVSCRNTFATPFRPETEPPFPKLSSLYADIDIHYLSIQQFLLDLATRQTLERFVVFTHSYSAKTNFNKHVKKFDNQPIHAPLLPHHKRAFLSIVSKMKPLLDTDSITHIFGLATRSATRMCVVE